MERVLITGISSELGKVIGNDLAKSGAFEIIGTMRRRRADLDFKLDPSIHVIDQCDLTDIQQCEELAYYVGERFNSPVGVIHCVGDFWHHVPFLEYKAEKAARMFESHVITLYNVTLALTPMLSTVGGGSVVAFSCNSVKYNYPWMAPFTAAKSAVDSLVKSLANEHSKSKIRFNSLVLASVQTEKVRASKPHGDFENFIPPKDVLPVIRFLISDQAYLVSGNAIALFRHSDRFFGSSYFERNGT